MTKCKELHDVAHRLFESHTVSNTASLLGVSRKTNQHWKMPPQHTRKARDKKPGRPFKLTGYLAKRLRRWVNEDPNQTLDRLRQHTCTDAGVCVSRPIMSCWLKQLGLTRKRTSFRNSEMLQPRVAKLQRQFLNRVRVGQRTNWKYFVNVDECSWHHNQTTSYAWSDAGKPAVITRPAARGQRFTLTLAIGVDDTACVMWTCAPRSRWCGRARGRVAPAPRSTVPR